MTLLNCEQCGAELPAATSSCERCGRAVSVAQLGPVLVSPAKPQPRILPEPEPSQAAPQYAGFWLRAAAFVIDTFLCSLLFSIAASFIPYPLIVLPLPGPPSLSNIPQLTSQGLLLMFSSMWLYYALFESSSWQATPGKRALKLYVTDLNGRPVSFGRASLRYVGRRISELTFMIGYLMAAFTARKQALHDLISSCLVLRRR
jgi:uncharacterized RDD family membrane protein YckC